ncbi:unnamed protein product, partial [Bubo scandiacus]
KGSPSCASSTAIAASLERCSHSDGDRGTAASALTTISGVTTVMMLVAAPRVSWATKGQAEALWRRLLWRGHGAPRTPLRPVSSPGRYDIIDN